MSSSSRSWASKVSFWIVETEGGVGARSKRLKPANLASGDTTLPTSSSKGESESDKRKDETRWPLEEVKELGGSVIFVLFFIHFVKQCLDCESVCTYKRATLPALLRPNQEPPALTSRPDRTLPSTEGYWPVWKEWKWTSCVGLSKYSSRLVQRILYGSLKQLQENLTKRAHRE